MEKPKAGSSGLREASFPDQQPWFWDFQGGHLLTFKQKVPLSGTTSLPSCLSSAYVLRLKPKCQLYLSPVGSTLSWAGGRGENPQERVVYTCVRLCVRAWVGAHVCVHEYACACVCMCTCICVLSTSWKERVLESNETSLPTASSQGRLRTPPPGTCF